MAEGEVDYPKRVDARLMKRYLLGTASPAERIALENEYIPSPEIFECLAAAENDLIDSYTRGRLSDLEKQQFEKRYLTSERGRARVDFARTLSEVCAEPRRSHSVAKDSIWHAVPGLFHLNTPLFRWGLATCTVALIVAIALLQVQQHTQVAPRPTNTENVPTPGHAKPPLTAPLPEATLDSHAMEFSLPRAPAHSEFTMRLSSGLSRAVGSVGPKTFVVPPGTSSLNVQLILDDADYSRYAVSLETADGKVVRKANGLRSIVRSGRKIVAFRLPTRVAPAGDYIVDLTGSGNDGGKEDNVGSYSFRITYK